MPHHHLLGASSHSGDLQDHALSSVSTASVRSAAQVCASAVHRSYLSVSLVL